MDARAKPWPGARPRGPYSSSAASRAAVAAALASEPGLTRAELAARLAMPWSSVAYTLAGMQRRGDVVRRDVGRRARFFLPARGDLRAVALREARADPLAGRVLQALARGPLGLTAVARQAGAGRKAVGSCLERLRAAGVVSKGPRRQDPYALAQGLPGWASVLAKNGQSCAS